MDKNSRDRTDKVKSDFYCKKLKKNDNIAISQVKIPAYNRHDALSYSKPKYLQIDSKTIQSLCAEPYIDHLKIIRIKRQLKAKAYNIRPRKIAGFMLKGM